MLLVALIRYYMLSISPFVTMHCLASILDDSSRIESQNSEITPNYNTRNTIQKFIIFVIYMIACDILSLISVVIRSFMLTSVTTTSSLNQTNLFSTLACPPWIRVAYQCLFIGLFWLNSVIFQIAFTAYLTHIQKIKSSLLTFLKLVSSSNIFQTGLTSGGSH